MVNINKGFLNIVQGRLNFTNYPDLNMTVDDMGEDRLTLTLESEVVRMADTATGQVAIPQIFVKGEFAFSIVKTSPMLERWQKQVMKNGALGEGSFSGDTKEVKLDLMNIAISSFGPIDVGSTASIGFRVKASILVNQDLYSLIS